MLQRIWLFVFRGEPDTWNNRHTLLYLDSPDDDDFHYTTHVNRPHDGIPFNYDEENKREDYTMAPTYLHGRLVGEAQVDASDRRQLVGIVASLPVGGEADWNCQDFIYSALDALASHGILGVEQVGEAKNWLDDSLIDEAIG